MFDDVRGWLGMYEAALLMKLAENRNVLEVGTYCGLSTLYMAQTAKSILTIDCFFGGFENDTDDKITQAGDTLAEAWSNIRKYGVADKVHILTGKFEDVADFLDFSVFDFVFYDPEHTYESTKKGISILLPRLREDCAWAFHDFTNWLGVKQAVEELLGTKYYRHNYEAETTFAINCTRWISTEEMELAIEEIYYKGGRASYNDKKVE